VTPAGTAGDTCWLPRCVPYSPGGVSGTGFPNASQKKDDYSKPPIPFPKRFAKASQTPAALVRPPSHSLRKRFPKPLICEGFGKEPVLTVQETERDTGTRCHRTTGRHVQST
jgi:hypothetical protein